MCPTYSRALRVLCSACSRALLAPMPYVFRSRRVLVLRLPFALRAFVLYVSRTLRALVPPVPRGLRALALHVPCGLRVLVLYVLYVLSFSLYLTFLRCFKPNMLIWISCFVALMSCASSAFGA